MSFKIYNTATQDKTAICEKDISMYVCGVTVYDRIHIGNARTAVFFDTVYRILQSEHNVRYINNITDIDQKIIDKSYAKSISWDQVANMYTKHMHEDYAYLGISKSIEYHQATQYIPQMINIITKLIQNHYAYVADDGIYFNGTYIDNDNTVNPNINAHLNTQCMQTDKDEDPQHAQSHYNANNDNNNEENYEENHEYNQQESINVFAPTQKIPQKKIPQIFAKNRSDSSDNISRIQSCTEEKDFALWKFRKDPPHWSTPWGDGIPGWHTECFTMIDTIFDKKITLHGGGKDLCFPHHENERIQCMCLNNRELTKTWMHVNFLNLHEEKMSKSLNNMVQVNELKSKYHGEVIRLLLLKTHYRHELNFKMESLHQAHVELDYMYHIRQNMRYINNKHEHQDMRNTHDMQKIEKTQDIMQQNNKNNASNITETDSLSMYIACDACDININQENSANHANFAHGKQYEIQCTKEDIEFINIVKNDFNLPAAISYMMGLQDAEKMAFCMHYLGLGQCTNEQWILQDNSQEDVRQILEKRHNARNNKDFALSDQLRIELANMGISVQDTQLRQIIRKLII